MVTMTQRMSCITALHNYFNRVARNSQHSPYDAGSRSDAEKVPNNNWTTSRVKRGSRLHKELIKGARDGIAPTGHTKRPAASSFQQPHSASPGFAKYGRSAPDALPQRPARVAPNARPLPNVCVEPAEYAPTRLCILRLHRSCEPALPDSDEITSPVLPGRHPESTT